MTYDKDIITDPTERFVLEAHLDAIKNDKISISTDGPKTTYSVSVLDNITSVVVLHGYDHKTLQINGVDKVELIYGKNSRLGPKVVYFTKVVFDAFAERIEQMQQQKQQQEEYNKRLSSNINEQELAQILTLIKQGKADITVNHYGIVGTIVLENGKKVTCEKYISYDMKDIYVNDKKLIHMIPNTKVYDEESIAIANKICDAVMDAHEILHQKFMEKEKAKYCTPERIARFKQQQEEFIRKIREYVETNNQKKK